MARFLDLYGGCLRDSPQKRRPGKALPGHRKFPILILKSFSLYLWKWKLQITNLEHSLSSADILKAQRFAETAFQFHNICEKGAKKSQHKCMNYQRFVCQNQILHYIYFNQIFRDLVRLWRVPTTWPDPDFIFPTRTGIGFFFLEFQGSG